MSKSLLIFGGGGFLGQNICKLATLNGWKVTSVSRSGSPQFRSNIPYWATKIKWESGDLFDPSSYSHLLKEPHQAIVHSVGAYLEGNYKDQVKKGELFGLLRSAIQSKLNPSPANSRDNTYNKLNFQSFKILIDELNKQSGERTFKPVVGYVSASPILPIDVNPNYLNSKRASEQYLLTNSHPNYKPLIFQPGLMYSDERSLTLPLAGALSAANTLQTMICKDINLVSKPLHVNQVAEGIVKAIDQTLINEEKTSEAPIFTPQKLINL
ncbi:NAD(P)-binding protein [Conidiobolus coronatus NRRL 28638]|uniref:NAD(P)-binding protein n=1 Tax=Conidiobolus coronatus (strain ATCC 28846 / CBS 209.66 / NRRL 28638) TaxID=796925 RepID=A0A137P6S0_CONC2|nr:NAD(P)-binding protein [Conidiobolus coronatus NRRL 28638]|eukprot:KXN70621.1 NAD(P)-binding protein [Conidiobolus coronatus NRRL 28638]